MSASPAPSPVAADAAAGPPPAEPSRRWAAAAKAAALLVAAVVAHTLWPTRPALAVWYTLILGGSALWAAVLAAWPRALRGRRQSLALVLGLVRLTALVGVLPHLILANAGSFLIALGIDPPLAVAPALAELTAFVAFWGWKRRTGAGGLRPWELAMIVVLLNTACYPALCHWMWSPPSEAECRALERPGEVTRLSPAAWVAEPAQPYDVFFVPGARLLVAAFKMAGNATLAYWNNPESNRLFVTRTDGEVPHEWAQLPTPGLAMPEFIEYDAGRNQILLTRYGRSEHFVDIIDLEAFPVLRKVASIPLGGNEPNGVALHGDGEELSVFTFNEAHSWLRYGRADLTRHPAPELETDLSTNHVWHEVGSPFAYLSTLRKVVEVELQTGRVRMVEVPFGGGDIIASVATGRIYQTDYLWGAFNVVRIKDMSLVERKIMGFSVRAVYADAARDLLFVGDWFNGVVHVYRLRTLEPLPVEPVPVGPYLRYFAYDQQSGDLYASTKCGVYQVRADLLRPRWL